MLPLMSHVDGGWDTETNRQLRCIEPIETGRGAQHRVLFECTFTFLYAFRYGRGQYNKCPK